MEEYNAKPNALDLSEMPSLALQPQYKDPKEMRVCGVRFGEYGRVFNTNCDSLSLALGDPVIAEIPDKGLMYGYVARPPMTVDVSGFKVRLPKLMRKANDEDISRYESICIAEDQGFEVVKSRIDRLKLPMQLLRVEYTFDRHKAIVYFAAENRVDFRELLKELIRELQTRVELRQVGVRDQARDRGAIGPCGEETCCSRFINKFSAVSIKMARDQGLSLTPTKVSGNCGRLKCCLAYEHPVYQMLQKETPRKSKCVKCKSSGACGIVQDVNLIKGEVVVKFDDGTIQTMPASEVVETRPPRNEKLVATSDEQQLVDQIKNSSYKKKNHRPSGKSPQKESSKESKRERE